MAKIEDILIQMKNNPTDVRFSDLSKAKADQIKQVLLAIEKLEVENVTEK